MAFGSRIFGTPGEWEPQQYQTYLHKQWDLETVTTVNSNGTPLPCNYFSTSEATLALSWNEMRWAITGKNVSWETFKTEEEALRKAKLVAGQDGNADEVLILKVVRRVRPVPKEVEVEDVKD